MLRGEYSKAIRILTAAALIIALAAFSGCMTRRSSTGSGTGATEGEATAPKTGKQQASRGGSVDEEAPSLPSADEPEASEGAGQQGAVTESAQAGYVFEETEDAQASGSPTIADPPAQARRPASTGGKAKLAIVIDDFGYRSEATSRILAIEEPLTCAVLPDARTTAQDGLDAYNAGKLVILHMPMEAIDGSKSEGDGFIRAGMDELTVKSMLSDALGKVPMAEGISNHMGSRVSQDRQVLGAVIEEARDRGLFYLDSRTTSGTVGPEVARSAGAEAYINDIFIDSVDDAEYVKAKLWEAADRALQEGQAVAIGHVKLSTAKALEEVLPKMLEYGVELVFVNELSPIV